MTKRKAPEDKLKVGRKTKYKPEYVDLTYNYCLLGADDKRLAEFFEVEEKTINTWKKMHPEFLQALKAGKGQADALVAKSLFHRAVGYEHPDVDIKMFQGQIIKTDIVKHYPPDTIAGIFWLKNRQKNEWRERQEVDHTSKGDKIATPLVYLPQDLPHDVVQPPAE